MGLQSRIKKLEEQCGLRKRQRIFIVRHFSEDLEFPPIEEQIAAQRKEGKKIIVVRAKAEIPPSGKSA